MINSSPDLFELMGMYVGDGCISVNDRYKEFALSGDITEEREYYENHVIPLFNKTIMQPLLDKKVTGKAYPSVGVFGFMIFNRKLVEYLVELGLKPGPKTNIKLPELIMKAKPALQARFLRGLFDTDGSIYFDKNYSAKCRIHCIPKIKLAMVSETLKNQTVHLLNNMGIGVMDKKPYQGNAKWNPRYEIIIYRKSDLDTFIKKVGFASPKHKTKIAVYNALGYCPPNTTITQRKSILGMRRGGYSEQAPCARLSNLRRR